MAERRMFAKTIIDSDAFLDMPMSARLLYYDLGMRADDDGFINAPKKIMRLIGATTDDMNILIARKFVIPFESGVVVIKAWRINNYLRSDRYTETKYLEEKSNLTVDERGMYHTTSTIGIPDGIPVVYPDTVSTGKDRLDKDSIGEDSKDDEVSSLRSDTSCGEPSKSATPPKEPPEPVFIKIPLNDKTEYEVTEKKVAEYQETYPAVDIRQQLRNMKQWSVDNPTKRKTRVGITRFMNSWMQREQDRGGQRYQSQQSSDAEWLAKKEREKNERK